MFTLLALLGTYLPAWKVYRKKNSIVGKTCFSKSTIGISSLIIIIMRISWLLEQLLINLFRGG